MNNKYRTKEESQEARRAKQRGYSLKYYKSHKKETSLRNKKWRLEHPDYYKEYRRKKRSNIEKQ